ncbi:MAG: cobalamin biosynthesis bifunctional protein CbiET [Magnetovibrio sp.]|nr:cobalamin biosynthesis bifunctional protein CbiET [Magnetovibrio sp.]
MSAWITVIGMGEDGMQGLSSHCISMIQKAEVIFAGERHHCKVQNTQAEVLDWGKGFNHALKEIEARRGKNIVVLASGDPMNFGVGSVLVRVFGKEAVNVYPAPGSFSLAASRMGWPIPEVDCLTIHGRPIENLIKYFSPGARLLILSHDGSSPEKVANLLNVKGYGKSKISVLEHLGGVKEKRIDGRAVSWNYRCAQALNTLAVECVAEADTVALSRVPGLPDEVFENDGQLTKSEVRAITIAQLRPLPGQVLWDIGAGSGSISIEWLRLGGHRKAIAIERDCKRISIMKLNAANLGTMDLVIIEGDYHCVKDDIPFSPDAIFIGGGASDISLLRSAWKALGPKGRIVINAVSIEAEQSLLALREEIGGQLSCISIKRATPIGTFSALKPMLSVTQFVGIKPS